MSNIASACTADLRAKVMTLPQFGEKVFELYSIEEIEDRTRGLRYPCAAVVWESLRSVNEKGAGLGAEASCLIVVLVQDGEMGVSFRGMAEDLLDSIRNAIGKTKGPANHPWKFAMESPFPVPKDSILSYAQRWVTYTPLT